MSVTGLERAEAADFIRAYELARAHDENVDMAHFLPPHDDPLYAEVHGRLLARDMEHRAARNAAAENVLERTVRNNVRLGAHRPGAQARQALSSACCGEELATDQVVVRVHRPEELSSPSRLALQAMDRSSAVQELPDSGGGVAARLAGALAEMPSAGADFFGFKILAEIGRGAFGRVYLARQRDLASRHVALKVSPDILGESQTLAQLQHTNIVPIYSVHRSSPLQAVCMPYFGATTLADLLKNWRERESLPESGKELVSTLWNRKQLTRQMRETDGSQQPASVACPPLAVDVSADCPAAALPGVGRQKGTAILDMLQGLSFVQAVLWIASRLADGLAHAHERGILHRDLKPANVLITDEGQPMLLDFSVAEDTKLRREAISLGQMGGTLAYMAPEHLEAFQGASRSVDARSDLYSLGVVLYEMLTRRPPFRVPDGALEDVLPHLAAERNARPPRLRGWNRTVSPAVESIVRHCLEPDPARRYQSAHELREDLDRHRANLPLKYAPEPSLVERTQKWARRHPRLTSLTSFTTMTAVLLSIIAGWCLLRGQRLAELEAADTLNRFQENTRTVQFLLNARSSDRDHLEEGIRLGREALENYQVLDKPAWQEQQAVRHLSAVNHAKLRAELQDLLLLLSRATLLRAAAADSASQKQEQLRTALDLNRTAESVCQDEPASQALLAQRVELLTLLGQRAEAQRLHRQAEQTPLRTARDHYLAGTERLAQGRYREALPLLQAAAEEEPQNFWARLVLGICYDALAQDQEARACYTTSIALYPEFPWPYFNRGLVYLRQNDFRKAAADFNRVIHLRPDFAEVYMNRALAWQGVKNYAAAVKDLTRAQDLGAASTRIYFMRARARELAGDAAGAGRDLAEGLRLEPGDEKSWIARGVARLPNDLPGALADFEKAARQNPRSLAALQNQAHVLSRMGRNEDALRILDQVIELYPDYVPARAGRGVLRARLQQRKAAHQDADDALARDFGAATQYQVAGIFALTSRQDPLDRSEALRYLSSALRKGFGFDLLEQDKDLDPIRDRPEFCQLVNAARALQAPAAKKP
ncbi:MAG TPA: protein kinase [Gemmataceae bacterium]|nr:protein kinase [Gemmataceae bacterium]